jgi:mannose/fructose/N-acetylgalactosamine-specific phosphotransferase system component IIC
MSNFGWSICIVIGLLAYAITDNIRTGVLWGSSVSLVCLLIIAIGELCFSKKKTLWK